MKGKVKIYYDDDVFSIVDKFNDLLKPCGLVITEGEDGDGWEEFILEMHDQLGEDICE